MEDGSVFDELNRLPKQNLSRSSAMCVFKYLYSLFQDKNTSCKKNSKPISLYRHFGVRIVIIKSGLTSESGLTGNVIGF